MNSIIQRTNFSGSTTKVDYKLTCCKCHKKYKRTMSDWWHTGLGVDKNKELTERLEQRAKKEEEQTDWICDACLNKKALPKEEPEMITIDYKLKESLKELYAKEQDIIKQKEELFKELTKVLYGHIVFYKENEYQINYISKDDYIVGLCKIRKRCSYDYDLNDSLRVNLFDFEKEAIITTDTLHARLERLEE